MSPNNINNTQHPPRAHHNNLSGLWVRLRRSSWGHGSDNPRSYIIDTDSWKSLQFLWIAGLNWTNLPTAFHFQFVIVVYCNTCASSCIMNDLIAECPAPVWSTRFSLPLPSPGLIYIFPICMHRSHAIVRFEINKSIIRCSINYLLRLYMAYLLYS